jgi:ribulose-5-phosphate 4-epimerase/fuculose-1-phosphate aldolase
MATTEIGTESAVRMIDGVELTPKQVGLDGPPVFATVEEERLHRKQKLAGGLRIFGRVGFGEGVAGHITVRDPEYPDHFWVNPFGMSFRHVRVSDLILVNHSGDVVYGSRPVNRAAFVIHSAIHRARPDVISAAHSHSVHGKAFASLGIPLDPITQDACIFYNDHTVIREQGGAVVFDIDAGKELAAAFPTGKAAIHQNHGLFTVGETVDEAVFWFLSMDRSCATAGDGCRHSEAHRAEHGQVHLRTDRLPAGGLVQLPAVVAGDLPDGSGPVRLTPSCSSPTKHLLGQLCWAMVRRWPRALLRNIDRD